MIWGNWNEEKNVYLDLTIGNDEYVFATTINEAMMNAENELVVFNETIDSLKD